MTNDIQPADKEGVLMGRKTVMTDETLRKLEGAYSNGATDKEACNQANISPSTLYLYQNKYPDFVEYKEALKSDLTYQAKKTLKQELQLGGKGVGKLALDVLKAKDSDYNPVQKSVNITTSLSEVLKQGQKESAERKRVNVIDVDTVDFDGL